LRTEHIYPVEAAASTAKYPAIVTSYPPVINPEDDSAYVIVRVEDDEIEEVRKYDKTKS
jgi:hypothetical protein